MPSAPARSGGLGIADSQSTEARSFEKAIGWIDGGAMSLIFVSGRIACDHTTCWPVECHTLRVTRNYRTVGDNMGYEAQKYLKTITENVFEKRGSNRISQGNLTETDNEYLNTI